MIKHKWITCLLIGTMILGFSQVIGAKKKNPDALINEILLTEPDKPISQKDFDQIVNLGDSGIDPLIKIAKDDSQILQVRWVSTRAIGKIGEEKYQRLENDWRADQEDFNSYNKIKHFLITMLSDPSPFVRIAASSALGDIGDGSAAENLLVLLSPKQPVLVKSAAVDSLGKLKSEKAIKPLKEQLYAQENFYRGQSLWIRTHIVSALGQINSPEVLEILRKASSDNDSQVSKEAKTQLARIQG